MECFAITLIFSILNTLYSQSQHTEYQARILSHIHALEQEDGIGFAGFGLEPENHRYFDYHHSEHDTIDKVHRRELEMGAIVIAMLSYLISEM